MREIKFRGLRTDGGGWLYGDLCHINEQVIISPKWDYPYQWDNVDMNVIPESVGQYTGLKDINGVEIYEGDSLKVTEDDEDSLSNDFNFEGVVIYGNDGKKVGKNFVTYYPCSFTIYCKDFHHEEGLLGNSHHHYEVIGNIHQKTNK